MTRPRALAALITTAVMLVGCSNGEDGDAEAASGAAGNDAAAAAPAASSPVFPQSIAKGFDDEVTAPIPGGGTAAVGIICRGSGADVFYVGVKGAASVPDGVHDVHVDGLDETLRFATGAPDSGVGAGAAQAAFDKAEYTFTFEGLDVAITIGGCGEA